VEAGSGRKGGEMTDYYPEIYAMEPHREVEPGWWSLKWKPIRKGTFHFYCFTWEKNLGLYIRFNRIQNGWGRSYKRLDFNLGLGFRTYNAWIKYDYLVHKDGPSDVPDQDRRPLNIPEEANSCPSI
jgi:hypothetical protein